VSEERRRCGTPNAWFYAAPLALISYLFVYPDLTVGPIHFIIEKVTEKDGLNLYTVRIDPKMCTDCGVCVSFEWWCPAKAIAAA
jgi:ferredoxin